MPIPQEEPEIPKSKLKKGTITPVEATDEECKREKKKNWAWLGTYLFLLIGMGVTYYLVYMDIIPMNKVVNQWAEKLLRAAMFALLILAASRLVDALAISNLSHNYTRYNLRRVLKLVTVLLIGLTLVSIIFVNWYAAAVSLGLISLILGFALQTPITSFIGWIYILVKRPYKVGDRVQIDDVTGDVIDVGYLDTTLWEFGGKYLTTDQPSGRIIKFPNSLVLSTTVYNYSWEYFPYMWNEIKMYVAYQSDLHFIAHTMESVVTEHLGEKMMKRTKMYRELLADSPIDELTVNEKPTVLFRAHENTWIEATVRYIVDSRKAGTTRSNLVKSILEEFNKAPEKVMMPRGDAR